jgi:hypothetical protein
MAALPPRFHITGQNDGIGILIRSTPHSYIADRGMLQAFFPVHDGFQV